MKNKLFNMIVEFYLPINQHSWLMRTTVMTCDILLIIHSWSRHSFFVPI